jgi:hypothetical protein
MFKSAYSICFEILKQIMHLEMIEVLLDFYQLGKLYAIKTINIKNKYY